MNYLFLMGLAGFFLVGTGVTSLLLASVRTPNPSTSPNGLLFPQLTCIPHHFPELSCEAILYQKVRAFRL